MKKLLLIAISLIIVPNIMGDHISFDEFTASETSIYSHLNTNLGKIEDVLNAGLKGDNFDSSFAIGSDQIGANAVSNTQLQDYCIDALNLQTGAVDTRIILDGTIEDDDMADSIRPDNFFDRRNRITFTYQTAQDFDDRWRFECEENSMARPQDFRVSNWVDGVWQFTSILLKNDTGYIGLHNVGDPQADVDINGSLRVQDQAHFDGGVSNPWTKLAVNSTAPSVNGGNNFYTANCGTGCPSCSPITYTNFNGGVAGQRILVRVMDAYSTFSSATTTHLWTQDTDADWGALSSSEFGVIYEFQLVGTEWYCLNRYGPFMQGTAGGGTPPTFGGASEDWESGGFTGGSGFVAGHDWTHSIYVGPTTAAAQSGTYSMQILGNDKYIYRPINTVGVTGSITLSFYEYEPPGNTITWEVHYSTDHSAWTLMTSVAGTSGWDKISHTWTPTAHATLYIRIMNATANLESGLIDTILIE